MNTLSDFKTLESLLEGRLRVIADHEWRDRDAASHLEELKRISLAIMAEHTELKPKLPARLNHFLTQASYQKALDYLRENQPDSAS